MDNLKQLKVGLFVAIAFAFFFGAMLVLFIIRKHFFLKDPFTSALYDRWCLSLTEWDRGEQQSVFNPKALFLGIIYLFQVLRTIFTGRIQTGLFRLAFSDCRTYSHRP